MVRLALEVLSVKVSLVKSAEQYPGQWQQDPSGPQRPFAWQAAISTSQLSLGEVQ